MEEYTEAEVNESNEGGKMVGRELLVRKRLGMVVLEMWESAFWDIFQNVSCGGWPRVKEWVWMRVFSSREVESKVSRGERSRAEEEKRNHMKLLSAEKKAMAAAPEQNMSSARIREPVYASWSEMKDSI